MELVVNEVNTVDELPEQPPLGIFVKFRYTLREKETPDARLFSFLFDKASIITAGYEVKDKFGKPTHPHIHYHMLINDKIANIRGRLKTFFKAEDETRSGNELYSLAEEKDVKDLNRFFRYVWKQGGRARGVEKLKLLKHFDIDTEVKCAMEEYLRSCQFNNDKIDKSTRANTYDKIVALLLDNPPTTVKQVIDRIRDFYIKEGLACNASTIAGYATTYSLGHGLLDPEAFSLKVLSLI